MEQKKIAILAEKQYQDLELWYPKLRLQGEGMEVDVAGVGEKRYTGKWGYPVDVDLDIKQCKVEDFDAVIIPGGFAPDYLRRSKDVVNFVKEMFEKGKVVAAICHGPSVLVSAQVLKGKTATSYFAIKDDVINAGANFVDKSVVVDGNLITSRKPEDLPDFCREIIKALK